MGRGVNHLFFGNTKRMNDLAQRLIDWFDVHGRKMEWRDTFDPYLIWIAEIIFQQTRIQQGLAYYQRFINRFPDVNSLAQADLDEVLKHWEGLGYYSRARNLHKTAKLLVEAYCSTFPDDYRELLKLKGIGPYTARAIGSFAFGNPVGVLDGNTLRVVSRVRGDFTPIDQSSARKSYQEQIDTWASSVNSRRFNHGMMDLGATICTPTQPACLICPLEAFCIARKEGSTALLPVKSKTLERPTRYFNFYLIFNGNEELAILKRPEKGLWGGLWEIPNEELTYDIWSTPAKETFLGKFKHAFTHFDMLIHVHALDTLPKRMDATENLTFIPKDKISIFAFSKAVNNIFTKLLN